MEEYYFIRGDLALVTYIIHFGRSVRYNLNFSTLKCILKRSVPHFEESEV